MPSQKGSFQRESKAELKEHRRRCCRHGSSSARTRNRATLRLPIARPFA